nr:MAG TPA: hypothetical protein [Bacteriophage sp.]
MNCWEAFIVQLIWPISSLINLVINLKVQRLTVTPIGMIIDTSARILKDMI